MGHQRALYTLLDTVRPHEMHIPRASSLPDDPDRARRMMSDNGRVSDVSSLVRFLRPS